MFTFLIICFRKDGWVFGEQSADDTECKFSCYLGKNKNLNQLIAELLLMYAWIPLCLPLVFFTISHKLLSASTEPLPPNQGEGGIPSMTPHCHQWLRTALMAECTSLVVLNVCTWRRRERVNLMLVSYEQTVCWHVQDVEQHFTFQSSQLGF